MMDENIHILLVDDDDIDCEEIERYLIQMNFLCTIQTAKSKAIALDLLEKNSYDIVLLDFNLGDGTGLEVMPYTGDTPVVFITGSGSEEIAVKAMGQGAYDYLVKDLARSYIKMLPPTLQNVLKRKRAEVASKTAQEELDSILRTVPDIIYRLNNNSVITFISNSVRKYGYQPADIIGRSVFDIVHPDDHEKAIFRINERRGGDRSTKSFEIRLLTKNQLPIPFEIFSVSAEGLYPSEKISSDTFMGTQGIARDISKRKIAEIERERLIHELQEALDNIRTLNGLLPMCASCKKIRDDKGYWNQLEEYIQNHSEATFTHGMCPECSDKFYGGEEWYIKMKNGNKQQKE